jgi:hypothetical protein
MVLRKLSRMTLTLELQILRLAILLRSIIHPTRLSLTLRSPYNIYYKAVMAYKFFQIGYILLCFLLVFYSILRLFQFTEVLRYQSLNIYLHCAPFGCISDK